MEENKEYILMLDSAQELSIRLRRKTHKLHEQNSRLRDLLLRAHNHISVRPLSTEGRKDLVADMEAALKDQSLS